MIQFAEEMQNDRDELAVVNALNFNYALIMLLHRLCKLTNFVDIYTTIQKFGVF